MNTPKENITSLIHDIQQWDVFPIPHDVRLQCDRTLRALETGANLKVQFILLAHVLGPIGPQGGNSVQKVFYYRFTLAYLDYSENVLGEPLQDHEVLLRNSALEGLRHNLH